MNNTKDKFDAKFEELLFNTLHLSSTNQMEEDPIFKELFSLGDTIIPYLIDKILNKPYIAFYVLLFRSTDIKIKEKNIGRIFEMREDVTEWWEKNKDKYLN